MSRFYRWLAVAVAVVVLLAGVNAGLSLLVGSRSVRRRLTARLEASFGRPVQVGHFGFSIWDGPRIEADSVTVGEDPRFGHEYFLRAGELGATLRWSSLLRGRVEFGSFSLSDASLNIVSVGGRWNLADWLPPATGAARGGPGALPRLYRIEIDNGRINFKRGTVKLPFALIDVNGSVDETAPGRWSLSLNAQPMRVAVVLQDAGTLHLSGHVGGTSTRLRPASLRLRWEDSSVSDVLRLFFGYDYGIRGRQDLTLQANSTSKQWQFDLDDHVDGLHSWDFVAQPGNPGLNVLLAGSWEPGDGNLRLARGRIEGPASSIALTGDLKWPVEGLGEGDGDEPPVPKFDLHLSTPGVGARDLLSWYHAFHKAIPVNLHASGWLRGSAEIDGWPLRIHRASISESGFRLDGGGLPHPVDLGAASLKISGRKAFGSLPRVNFGPKIGRFRVTGSARRGRRWRYRAEATGSSSQVSDLVDSLGVLGAALPSYWHQFSGGAKIKVDWSGTIPFSRQTVLASIDLRDAVWREPSLPARVRLKNALVAASGKRLRFDIRSATALGASWHGWLERLVPSHAWRFALETNRLDARSLIARLQSQEQRPDLLERIFGFGHAAGSPPLWPASLDASGTMRVERLSMAPLYLRGVHGRVVIHNGTLDFSRALARFSGGRARGSFFFSVEKGVPVWRVRTRLHEVDLARLSRLFPGAKNRFAGSVSGDLQLSARGVTARSLLDSLQGQAEVSIRRPRDVGINWLATLESGRAVSGRSEFERCSARVRLAGGDLSLENLSAVSGMGRLEATGGIDLARGGTLSVNARFFPASGLASPRPGLEERSYRVTGSSMAPLVHFLPSADTTLLPGPK